MDFGLFVQCFVAASSVAQTVHGSSGYPFSLPDDVHLDHRLVGVPSVVNRSKGVPLRVAGAFGRPTPLGEFRF